MLKLLSGTSTLSRIIVWMAIAALGFGLVGMLAKNLADVPENTELALGTLAKITLDSLVETFRIFVPKLDGGAGTSNWPLTIGRFLGSMVSFAATAALLFKVFREDIRRLRMVYLKEHTIIVGYDPVGKAIGKQFRKRLKTEVVIIDPSVKASIQQKAEAVGCFYLPAQLDMLTKAFKSTKIVKAAKVVISTGSDEDNLAVFAEFAKFLESHKTGNIELYLVLGNPGLVEKLEREDHFYALSSRNVHIKIFNLARETAVDFLGKEPIVNRALKMGHKSARVAIVGHSDTAIEIVIHFLKSAPCVGLLPPAIDWIVSDTSVLLAKLNERNQALYQMVSDALGDLKLRKHSEFDRVAKIKVHCMGYNRSLPDQELTSHIGFDPGSGITAVVIAEEADTNNAALALAFRNRIASKFETSLPIFVYSPEPGALETFLEKKEISENDPVSTATTKKIPQMEFFGEISQICAFSKTESAREAMARKIHEAFIQYQSTEDTANLLVSQSWMKPWIELPQTYKVANLRAADHWKTKMCSLGLEPNEASSNEVDLLLSILADKVQMERLAKIEHDAWWNDRLFNGWVYGKKRDNLRLIHPDLVSYNKLDEVTKEKDRDQVRFLLNLRLASINVEKIKSPES